VQTAALLSGMGVIKRLETFVYKTLLYHKCEMGVIRSEMGLTGTLWSLHLFSLHPQFAGLQI
jgi:hypothetical protein